MYSLLVETDYCLSQQYCTKIRFSFWQTTTACSQLFLSGRKKLSDEEIQELKEESESDINDQASEGALCNLLNFQRILNGMLLQYLFTYKTYEEFSIITALYSKF